MKKLLFVMGLIISMSCITQPISYTITINSESTRLTHVELEYHPVSDTLYMIPGGTNEVEGGRAGFVRNLSATDANGNDIKISKLPNAQWLLGSVPEKISLKYDMFLDHDRYEWSGGLDGTAYYTDWGIFYACRTLLLYPTGEPSDIQVRFDLPKNWKVTSPWDRLEGNTYEVTTLSQLQDGIFFAGTHEEISFKKDGFELLFAIGGPSVIAEKEMYEGLAGGVLDYYIELMGGLPNPPPKNPFSKSVVILNEHDVSDGEVLGNNISILVSRDADEMSKMIGKFIFAHEFFHLWNGKSFAPSDGVTCEWFKEGFTNYYTLKALYRIGQVDQNTFFDLLDNFFYQRYINDSEVGDESITRGDLKHSNWGLIYVGGLLAGITQDLIIRSETNNEYSLDEVMRRLFQKYGGASEGYTIDDLNKELSQVSGLDQTAFFNEYILGSTPIPIENYLKRLGIEATRENGHLTIRHSDLKENKLEIIQNIMGVNE